MRRDKTNAIFNYLFFTLIIASATLSLILNIPYIKLILGGFLVFLIPGFLIVNFLKMEKDSKFLLLILSFVSSISIIMLVGIICNLFGLLFHLSEPLSFTPLIVTLDLTNFLLLGINFFYGRDFDYRTMREIAASVNSQDINLFLGGIFIIVLTFITYFYHSSRLVLLIYVCIMLLVLMAGVKNEVNDSTLFFVIFAISFALIFTNVFLTPFLRGGDVHFEYLISQTIKENGLTWHPEVLPPIATRLNSVIPIVIVAPALASLFKISILEVFKTIFPFIMVAIPLAIFAANKNFFSTKIAFFSSFFVISIPLFPTLLPSMVREIFAFVFLSAIILLLYKKGVEKVKKAALLVLFSFSLIVSHYGVPYILTAVLIISTIFIFILKHCFKSTFMNMKEAKNINISISYSFLLLTTALAWAMYTNQAYNLRTVIYLIDMAISSTDSAYTLGGIPTTTMTSGSAIQILNTYSYILIFSLTGLMVIYKIIKRDFKFPHIIAASSLLLLPIFLFRNPEYELTRIIFICILFISSIFIEAMYSVFSIGKKLGKNISSTKIIIFILILFFMFQNGVVSEVANDPPLSYSISYEKLRYAFTFEEDIISAKWVSRYTCEYPVMMDIPGCLSVYDGFFGDPYEVRNKYEYISTEKMSAGYLVVRKGNILTNKLQTKGFGGFIGTEWTYPLEKLLSVHSYNKLYDNGGGIIYYVLK